MNLVNRPMGVGGGQEDTAYKGTQPHSSEG